MSTDRELLLGERPLLVDLYCCAGGAAKGYHDAGFDVVGVDKDPQPNYPYEFIQGDALEVFRMLVDTRLVAAAHGSPPCQLFTAYRRKGQGVGDGYENWIGPTREAFEATGLPYVIENVETAPLHKPVTFCGSSFGLDVRRHRLFESNFPLVAPPCNHRWQTPRFPQATNRKNLRRTVEVGAWRCADLSPAAMGIDWMTNDELSQAIPPAYTQFIGRQLLGHLRAQEAISA